MAAAQVNPVEEEDEEYDDDGPPYIVVATFALPD